MRVITFYSFKGGVGRTMALMNVAATLVERGRRVLLVDFDLEAPGIQTYEPFAREGNANGVVEYVTKYLGTREAPDVKDYLRKYRLNNLPIWLMPAGFQDHDYAARLSAIEWLKLYSDYDGYLMFEDLKQQWAQLNFDYVLVDSRTGHTDVAGICTRQLPEAVVMMFLPNDQNVSGLEEVARNIRMEGKEPRKKEIFLHFCPSNVPDLDDEDFILQRHLDDARSKLQFNEFASVIRHYNNLALLDQAIFVHTRPRTRLAEEYRRLADAIIEENLEDKDGALSKLEKIRSSLRSNRRDQDLAAIEKTLGEIYKCHRNNGEVAWSLSLVYELLSNVVAQREMLDIAIRHKFNEARARTKRAQILLRDPTSEMGREDLRHVLASKDVTMADLVASIERLREIDADWLSAIQASDKIKNLTSAELYRVVNSLSTSPAGAALAAKLLVQSAARSSRRVSEPKLHLVLAFIGTGRFSEAQKELGGREVVLRSNTIQNVFNFACAEWGQTGNVPIDLFSRVLEMAEEQGLTSFEEPNVLQCLSMASYLCGKTSDAYDYLKRAGKAINNSPPGLVFSCWRYLNVTREDFQADLDEMRKSMHVGQFVPRYLQQLSLLPQ